MHLIYAYVAKLSWYYQEYERHNMKNKNIRWYLYYDGYIKVKWKHRFNISASINSFIYELTFPTPWYRMQWCWKTGVWESLRTNCKSCECAGFRRDRWATSFFRRTLYPVAHLFRWILCKKIKININIL